MLQTCPQRGEEQQREGRKQHLEQRGKQDTPGEEKEKVIIRKLGFIKCLNESSTRELKSERRQEREEKVTLQRQRI